LGIPVIVTDVCGITSYLHDGNDAIVVPAGSCEALSEAISSMSNPERRSRIALAGKTKAHADFTVEKMVDRYEELLTK
jgi:glycosyltransferase involved in cell wall biosynthesis